MSIELPDRIVSRHRYGEGYQKKCNVPKNIVASIILKWKKFGTPETLVRAAPPGRAGGAGEQGLGQGGDQEPDGHSDRAPEFLCGDRKTLQKDNQSMQHSTNQAFIVEWPVGRHSSVKGT